MLRRAVNFEVARRRHTQAAVVGHAHAHQRRVRHVTDPHRTVKALPGQVDHPVAQVQRHGDVGMQFTEPGDQRRHMATTKTGRRGDAQMTAGLDAARRDAGLGIAQVSQQALAVLKKSTAFVRERNAPRGAHEQLHAQPIFKRVQTPAHHGRCHALGLGCGRQAAARHHRHKGFELFEFVHARLCPLARGIRAFTARLRSVFTLQAVRSPQTEPARSRQITQYQSWRHTH